MKPNLHRRSFFLLFICLLSVGTFSQSVHAETWYWPVPSSVPQSNYVSGGFGQWYDVLNGKHWGLDITPKSYKYKAPIVPVKSGTVVRSFYEYHNEISGNGFDQTGHTVVIRHDDDNTYGIYAHMSDHVVSVGEHVTGGKTIIGHMGSTGTGAGESGAKV